MLTQTYHFHRQNNAGLRPVVITQRSPTFIAKITASSTIISSVTFSHEHFKTLKRSQNDLLNAHDRNVSGKEYKTGCIQTDNFPSSCCD